MSGTGPGHGFRIEVADQAIADLADRLDRTRFAPRILPGSSGGTDPDLLRRFLAHWRHRFDWRATEAALNALPQRIVTVDGAPLHVLHVETRAPRSVPIVLTHGWPSSVLEFLPLIPLLTEPGAAGVPGLGFTVVVPSLPGTGWSGLPPTGPVEPARIADLWAELLSALGHERFGAAGGDIGGSVTNFLGARYPERVIGVHTHHPPLHPVLDDAVPLSDDERAYLEARALEPGPDAGYGALQQTRPDTLAAALSDSPAGLAAWILEKYRDWGDRGDEDLFAVFPPDTLAGILSLYWFTNSIGTSFRPYVDDAATPPLPPVTVPAAVSLTPEDAAYPRRFAERTYRDLRQWRGPDRGGHFLALERPARLARDLADFFAPLA